MIIAMQDLRCLDHTTPDNIFAQNFLDCVSAMMENFQSLMEEEKARCFRVADIINGKLSKASDCLACGQCESVCP